MFVREIQLLRTHASGASSAERALYRAVLAGLADVDSRVKLFIVARNRTQIVSLITLFQADDYNCARLLPCDQSA
jgi:hypothetical protein